MSFGGTRGGGRTDRQTDQGGCHCVLLFRCSVPSSFTYICPHVCMYVCMCLCICACVSVLACISECMRVCRCVCVRLQMCVCVSADEIRGPPSWSRNYRLINSLSLSLSNHSPPPPSLSHVVTVCLK
jgi:hypothetical protein